MHKFSGLMPLTVMLLGWSSVAFSSSEEEALMRAFGDEQFISIATGSLQPISQAPAVASVITADDIKEIGARDLDEILETVPGLHVSVASRGYLPLYTIRGIYSENNPQVLILVNDIPITNLYVGNRGELWGGMPVNNIARIEIIRGPGSAIYGADAFAGTINIITKTREDINGMQVGTRAGSFDTKEAWMLQGGSLGKTEYAFSLQYVTTDGHREMIDQDAQGYFDSLFFTNASLAPGPVNLQKRSIDTRLDLSRNKWKLRLGYQGRYDLGSGAGVAFALDPAASGESQRFNADLSYKTAISQNWDITAILSYFDTSAEPDLILYPPGAVFGGPFPDGVIARPYVYERHTRLDLSAFYYGLANHNIRLGAGIRHGDMYKIREQKNYVFAPGGIPVPIGGIQDVSNDPDNVFIQPQDREVLYAFIQDEWSLASNWKLTSGIRYDHYSDFGDTFNPRLALVWQTRPELTTKLLYGRAFRAPAFNELYNINNPVALGNDELEPETIDTYEVAFNYQVSQKLQTGLNLFHYRMKDVIRFSTGIVAADNSGKIDGNGLEIESNYEVSPSFRIAANYSYQKSTDAETNTPIANVPRHQAYFRANWYFMAGLNLNAQVNWVADRKRETADIRDKIDDYIITDLTLRYRSPGSAWEIALSGRNLFDEDAREPNPNLSPVDNVTPLVPGDLPLAGRHYYAELRFHFE